ncbi:MAG: LOG family protein, partial [Bacteroidota bacterium]
GTMDELFEAITWRQLDIHHKRIGLWSVDDYYADLWTFLSKGRDLGFMPGATFDAISIDTEFDRLLGQVT